MLQTFLVNSDWDIWGCFTVSWLLLTFATAAIGAAIGLITGLDHTDTAIVGFGIGTIISVIPISIVILRHMILLVQNKSS